MKNEVVQQNMRTIIGLKIRTNNTDEMSLDVAKIGKTCQQYFAEGIADLTPNRKNPGIMFAVYTEYDSDHHGDYSYIIGEEVSSTPEQLANLPETLDYCEIPSGSYTKLIIGPGKLPDTLIQAWQDIWQMNSEQFGSKRAYQADYEIYDHRAADPSNAVVDIYLGLK